MGEYLSTTITSPQVIAVGGTLAGDFTVTAPAPGNFYLLVEQYSAALAFLPGSRAYLRQLLPNWVNSTSLYTNFVLVAAGATLTASMALTVPNTDCYQYLFLKQRASNVVAGAFAVGTEYEIMSIGSTDFTLIGATANTVGDTFTVTGVGAGTGVAAELPDPDTDDTIDYVVVALESTAAVATTTGIDLGELMNLMITMMIVVMMMKMMMGMMGEVK